jgi:hypothetical protein
MFAAVLFLSAIPASAQDSYPGVEIFGGYSYLSVDLNVDFDDDEIFDLDEREGNHGFGFSLAGNFSPNIGLVGDFSYHKKELELIGPDLDSTTFVFLFGPRFSARSDAATGFGHVLIGGTRFKLEGFESDVGFTLGVGGGVDVNVGDSLAVRLAQVDYLPTRINGEWLNNLRFQIGLVFKAGGQ